MDSISVKIFSNSVRHDESTSFSIQATKVATAVDKTVSFQLINSDLLFTSLSLNPLFNFTIKNIITSNFTFP
ncbi:MAG: hypothetical protein H0W50_04220 [Parachlamydiaceae bacterium]|nr:hypothetical protein [Parachlamydiaceae bacterium]